MKEYKIIKTKDLEFSKLREIRNHNVEQLKESIKNNGFDDARVLLVIPNKNNKYIVAGGNHRLQALLDLGKKEVPCLVDHEGDLYQLAIQDNEAEKTFAPIDLFDYLDMIKTLKEQKLTQDQIAVKLKKSENMIKKYNKILKKVTSILDLCRSHQKDRVTLEETNVTFDFSEGWFRSSGLYDLNDNNQLKVIEWFINTRNCKSSKDLLNKESLKYKDIQDQVEFVKNTLDPSIDNLKLIEAIERGEYSLNRLEDVIKILNEGAKNKALFGVDSREELKKIESNSIDCIVTDPPWGVEFKPSRKTENPDFDISLEKALKLVDEVMKKCKRVCKENAHIYVFFPTTFYSEFKNVLDKYFKVYPLPLIWYKNNHNPCDFKNRYASIYETIFFCKMENGDMRKLNYKVSPDVIPFSKVKDKVHDSEKPIELLEYLIKNSTGENEVVLDPFMGSGNTLISASKNNRNYIGFEIDDKYESNFKKQLGDLK